jgi:membrane protease YdiL (CAAX protease family)
MKWSRWGVLLAMTPVSAWAAQTFGLGLQAHECRDITMYFKLLLWGPVVEELVFRVELQKWLAHRLSSVWLANSVASFVFGLMHYALTGLLSTWLVIVPSLVLGWAYSKTNSLVLVIGLHAILNLVFIGWICAFI